MLHSFKLKHLAVLLSLGLFTESCRRDSIDQVEIDAARARTRNTLTPLQQLGKQIFFDTRLSEPVGVQSCASCHAPQVGFSGFGEIPTGGAAAASGFKRGWITGIGEGANIGAFANRRPQSAAYATLSPVFQLVTVVPDAEGIAEGLVPTQEFMGGNFWDGRATGLRLGSASAEQALGPFLSTKEQNHHSPAAVLAKLRNNRAYIALWQAAFGTPDISNLTPAQTSLNYDRVGTAIAAYEASPEVNQFSSKFDAVLAGRATLTPEEEEGLRLFNNEAECYDCHTSSGIRNAPIPPGEPFTNFRYFNIGVPVNTKNPGGNAVPDGGLGAFLATSDNPAWRDLATANWGAFKTPTIRNVGKMQRFMHNGSMQSLEEVMHFYNTRDVAGAGWNGVPWGAPEYPFTLDFHGVGAIGLTAAQEAAIVAFMRTLDDGYTGVTQ
jgi:cytochrome c peroxidase